MDAQNRRSGSQPPSPWVFPVLAGLTAVTPFVERGLGKPISQQMNSLLLIAAIGIPVVSTICLLGKPKVREKVAVASTFCLGGAALLWVDWSGLNGASMLLGLAILLVPILVRLFTWIVRAL